MSKPLVMISSDDGVYSPGLSAMAEAVVSWADVVVVAPTRQQTAMSRSFSGHGNASLQQTTLRVNGADLPAYHCDCSPAQSVHFALQVLCGDRRQDLVLSGINYGENLGTNVTISGTVGVALEAASHGIPAVAVSLETTIENQRNYGDLDWDAAGHLSRLFAEKVLQRTTPHDVDVINVNVPQNATRKTPWRITTMARLPYFEAVFRSPSLSSRLEDVEISHGVVPEQMTESLTVAPKKWTIVAFATAGQRQWLRKHVLWQSSYRRLWHLRHRPEKRLRCHRLVHRVPPMSALADATSLAWSVT